MPNIGFDAKQLDKLVRKPHVTRTEYFDDAKPGLCLRIGPRAATWYYFRRVDGKLVRIALGSYDEFASVGEAEPDRDTGRPRASFTVAWQRVGDLADARAVGRHPQAEVARGRSAARQARAADEDGIVRNMAAIWDKAGFPAQTGYKRRKRKSGNKLSATSTADYRRALDAFVVAFGDEHVESLTARRIENWLEDLAARSASSGNRAAVVVRLLFAYATTRLQLPSNPAQGIRNPGEQRVRRRVLTREELRVLWRACELAGYPYGHALRLAICTGQRIGEVGNLRRSDVIDGGDTWRQVENKSGTRIDVHLADHARAILADCPDYGRRAPYFTAGSMVGDKGAETLAGIHSDRWNKVIPRHIAPRIEAAAKALKMAPIEEHWTPHDLRRTVRTGLTGWCMGVDKDTAERVLNHADGNRLSATYDHADYAPHVAEALEAWDTELALVLAGKPSSRKSYMDGLKKVRAQARRRG